MGPSAYGIDFMPSIIIKKILHKYLSEYLGIRYLPTILFESLLIQMRL